MVVKLFWVFPRAPLKINGLPEISRVPLIAPYPPYWPTGQHVMYLESVIFDQFLHPIHDEKVSIFIKMADITYNVNMVKVKSWVNYRQNSSWTSTRYQLIITIILSSICYAWFRQNIQSILSIIPCSVLILASDWLTAVKYGAVSHVWRHQREI